MNINYLRISGIAVGSRKSAENTTKMIEFNNIKPVIDKVFSIEQVEEAFRYARNGNHIGKIVIKLYNIAPWKSDI